MTVYDNAATKAAVTQAARDIAAFVFEHANPGELLTTRAGTFVVPPRGPQAHLMHFNGGSAQPAATNYEHSGIVTYAERHVDLLALGDWVAARQKVIWEEHLRGAIAEVGAAIVTGRQPGEIVTHYPSHGTRVRFAVLAGPDGPVAAVYDEPTVTDIERSQFIMFSDLARKITNHTGRHSARLAQWIVDNRQALVTDLAHDARGVDRGLAS